MAMLAEPRRKQKLSINPRGNNWSNDNNKFGQRLMEKFGWTKGKGLGANEDGKVDHVKVSVKTDQRGVGCSASHADNWIAHQDDFNSILENLNQSNTDSQTGSTSGEVISLESRSKNSRGRMHYKKFAKGKDLSSRTTEDLNCIFGVRKTKSSDSTPQCLSEENSDNESLRENENSGGLRTIRSSDSVQEYFAKKMAALKKSRTDNQGGSSEVSDVKTVSTTDDFEEETKDNKVNFTLGDDSEMQNSNKKSKKKKKKRKEEKDQSTSDSEETNRCLDNDVITLKNKNEKRQENSDIHIEEGIEGLKSCEMSSKDLKQSDGKMKQKKSKKKREESATDDQAVVRECISAVEEESLKVKKKSKKKKKDRNSDPEENLNLQKTENSSIMIKKEPKNISKLETIKGEDSRKTEKARTENFKELEKHVLTKSPEIKTKRLALSVETGTQGIRSPDKPNVIIPFQEKTKRQKMVERKAVASVNEFKKKGANIGDITGYMCDSKHAEFGNEWVKEETLKRKEKNRKRKLREKEIRNHGNKKKKM